MYVNGTFLEILGHNSTFLSEPLRYLPLSFEVFSGPEGFG